MFDLGVGTGRDYKGQSFSEWSKVIYGNLALVKPDSASGVGLDLHGHFTFQKEPANRLFLLGHVDPIRMERSSRTFHTELQFYSRHNPTTNTRLSWGFGAFHRFHKNQYLAPDDVVMFGNDERELGGAFDLHVVRYQRVHFSCRYEYSQARNHMGLDEWTYDVLVSMGVMVGLNRSDREPGHE